LLFAFPSLGTWNFFCKKQLFFKALRLYNNYKISAPFPALWAGRVRMQGSQKKNRCYYKMLRFLFKKKDTAGIAQTAHHFCYIK
jgi:hypothetical protein